MNSRNLVLFYGNNLSTQILTSRLSARLTELGHRVFFIHSTRSQKAAYSKESAWPEVYYSVILLEKFIFPFLDSQPFLPDAAAGSPDQLAERYGTSLLRVSKSEVNTSQTLEFLTSHDIHGGISVRFPFIFSEPILSYFQGSSSSGLPRFLWNLHSAILPRYAGYAPFRWVMFNEEPTASFTLHKLEKSIDSGDILAIRPQVIDYSLDLISAFLELIPSAVDMTVESVQKLVDGEELDLVPASPTESRQYYPRLTPEDRHRMVEKGLKFVDLPRLKTTYLENFSKPGTTHYKEFERLLNEVLGPPDGLYG